MSAMATWTIAERIVLAATAVVAPAPFPAWPAECSSRQICQQEPDDGQELHRDEREQDAGDQCQARPE